MEVWMQRIRELREERGLTQVRLAVDADMNPATLNRIEQGKANPNLKTLERLAGALGVEVVDLFPKVQSPLPEQEQWRPSLRTWIDFAGRLADRWEAEFEEREAEWQAAKPHIRKSVKRLPNLTWATEILQTYTDILAAVTAELNLGQDVYKMAEVQELFKITERLEEVWERTKPWYPGKQAPRMAEVIDLKQAMAKRVALITARSSQSA
jgi:transcriptional regulator with XRE-family HTH domain